MFRDPSSRANVHTSIPAISTRPSSRSLGWQLGYSVLVTLVAVLFLLPGCSDADPAAVAVNETITLGLRVHLLQSARSEALTSTLSDADVELLLARVNGIWSQTGIEWRIDRILREEAPNPEQFEEMRSGLVPPTFGALAGVIPRDHLSGGAWDVFFIRNLFGGVGGIYLPEIPAVLQPEVDPQGVHGLDGGLPRILAHELGHTLRLPHVPCTGEGNLMAAGCPTGDRTRLTHQQIRVARDQAARGVPFRGGRVE